MTVGISADLLSKSKQAVYAYLLEFGRSKTYWSAPGEEEDQLAGRLAAADAVGNADATVVARGQKKRPAAAIVDK